MSKYLEFDTPATAQAGDLASRFGLANHGLAHLDRVYWNLPPAALYEEAVFRKEGHIAHGGPFVVNTGTWSARAAQDKFIVREHSTEDRIWWGEYNRPYDPEKFSALLRSGAGVPPGRRALRPGLLRRRRPRLPDADPGDHRVRLALPFRPHHVHPAQEPGRVPVPRARVHGDRGALVPLRPAGRRHPHRDRHHPQLRPAAGPDLQLLLRRRDQEEHVHGAQLPACRSARCCRCTARPTSGRRAMRPSSSACPVPARPPSRPIPAGV